MIFITAHLLAYSTIYSMLWILATGNATDRSLETMTVKHDPRGPRYSTTQEQVLYKAVHEKHRLDLFGTANSVEPSSEHVNDGAPFVNTSFINFINFRPRTKPRDVVVVDFSVRLDQVVGLEEKSQIFSTNLFLTQEWSDVYLHQVMTLHPSIHKLRLATDKVWLPDTFVFNNGDDKSSGFLAANFVMLHSEGRVHWPSLVKLKTMCQVDITLFPFDVQNCAIRLGSWMHSDQRIRYRIVENGYQHQQKERQELSGGFDNQRRQGNETQDEKVHMDLTSFVDNSDWILISATLELEPRRHQQPFRRPRLSRHHRMNGTWGTEPQHDVVIRFRMRRRGFYYIWNIVIPCAMLTCLTMLTFWMAPETGEKLSLGLNVFLAFSMFMLLIAEKVPPTSENVPLIGLYLTGIMSLTAISVVMAVIVVNLHSRGETYLRPPRWVVRLFLEKLSPYLIGSSIDGVVMSVKQRLEYKRIISRATKRAPLQNLHNQIAQFRLYQAFLENVMWAHHNFCPFSDENGGQAQPNCISEHFENDLENIKYAEDESEVGDFQETATVSAEGHSPITEKNRLGQEVETSKDWKKETPGNNVYFDIPGNNRQHRTKSSAAKDHGDILAEWQLLALVVDRCLFILLLIATIFFYVVVFAMPWYIQ